MKYQGRSKNRIEIVAHLSIVKMINNIVSIEILFILCLPVLDAALIYMLIPMWYMILLRTTGTYIAATLSAVQSFNIPNSFSLLIDMLHQW